MICRIYLIRTAGLSFATGEYVADLKDMDWVQHLDPALNQILKDKSGKVYAYPLNQAKRRN